MFFYCIHFVFVNIICIFRSSRPNKIHSRHKSSESHRVTWTITVAICYCFLLQQTAIISWYIITSNYFKLNKRCATIRLTKWKWKWQRNNKKSSDKQTARQQESSKQTKHVWNDHHWVLLLFGIWNTSIFHLPFIRKIHFNKRLWYAACFHTGINQTDFKFRSFRLRFWKIMTFYLNIFFFAYSILRFEINSNDNY